MRALSYMRCPTCGVRSVARELCQFSTPDLLLAALVWSLCVLACGRYVTPDAHTRWSRVIAQYFSEACLTTHPNCGIAAQPLLFRATVAHAASSVASGHGPLPALQVNVR